MTFADLLGRTVMLGDGAMGTMIQASATPANTFGGCNDILNLACPNTVADIHRAYLEAGADWIETNTFGANKTALDDYGLADQLSQINLAGAQLARQAADAFSTPAWPRFVVGSIGPGTRLPCLRQVEFAELAKFYQEAALALLEGGVDAIMVETCQDLLQAKAGVIGARRAITHSGSAVPVIVSMTFQENGLMLLGTPVQAAVTALAGTGVAAIGLNCATGPADMTQPLRQLAKASALPVLAMPNAGLPQMGADGVLAYTASAPDFASAMVGWVGEFGLSSVAGCCGTTPDHIAAIRAGLGRGRPVGHRHIEATPALSSLYDSVEVRQDVSYLAIGERANVSGSKAFRASVVGGHWDEAVALAKGQGRFGAHVLDLCVDRTGGDAVADMSELAARLATSVEAPIMLDSSKPEVLVAGLEHLPGRSVVNSVNLEGGDGPGSKYQRVMEAVVEHGAAVVALVIDESGMAITASRKLEVATRLVNDLTTRWQLKPADIFIDLLAYPVTTGFEQTRAAAAETIEAIRSLKAQMPDVGTLLGISNVSFGLKPAARLVLNSVFLDECRQAGLDAAIIDAAKIAPLHRLPPNQVQAARDLLWDDHSRCEDPLVAFLNCFDSTAASANPERDELAGLTFHDRLVRRVVDALPVGLEADLDAALAKREAIDIINDDLLVGMAQVGELFGAGKLQLPFVLASAEVMKEAVAHLEPALRESQAGGSERGTLVLATVAGDVHDIGKNLVDIIVSNNGYKVVNLGVRVPLDDIAAAALANNATAIGLSGLLVRSAEVMAENLAELSRRGLGNIPVILGGAALSRAYVEGLAWYGPVFYGADAFDGLRVLDMLTASDQTGSPTPQTRPVGRPTVRSSKRVAPQPGRRSDIARDEPVPQPPFWGAKQVRGIGLDEVVDWLDVKALLTAQWGLRPAPGQTFADLARQQKPRLEDHLNQIKAGRLDQFALAYGYWPVYSDGEELVVLDPGGGGDEIGRFSFPRQTSAPYLSIPDYFRDANEAAANGPDVVALQLVTMGAGASAATAALFADNHYRDYLELHGLSVQLAEALAQKLHAHIRDELGMGGGQTPGSGQSAQVGQRYSFGYPACPDLAQRQLLFDLVGGVEIGVDLSPTFQLVPEQSTDALVVHHRQARYFSIR